jgi:uncharacterized integral membrane protein
MKFLKNIAHYLLRAVVFIIKQVVFLITGGTIVLASLVLFYLMCNTFEWFTNLITGKLEIPSVLIPESIIQILVGILFAAFIYTLGRGLFDKKFREWIQKNL